MRSLARKTARSVLDGVKYILSVIRAAHNVRDGVTVRFHSDMDKSFEGEVKAYCQDRAWIKTMAERYASKYGAR